MNQTNSPRRTPFGLRLPAVCLALGLLVPGVVRAGGRASPGSARRGSPDPAAKVREVQDVRYWTGRGSDPNWHKLDLYLPKGKKSYPVVLFVHGGAWVSGDKTFLGWGVDIGQFFARQGIGVAMPSYRLSPAVKHPEHVKDVARAFAWTYRHIAQYGGNRDQLFLCGHSAGGHLVSLLATDPAYLKNVGIKPSAVKGVISVSGVYRLPQLHFNFALPKGLGQAAPAKNQAATGFTFRLNLFSLVFGDDPKVLKNASPLNHVHRGLPPFLLVYAGHDFPFLPQMAREFARVLKAARCPVRLLQVKDRDHDTVMFNATSATDPVARAICHFVAKLVTNYRPKPNGTDLSSKPLRVNGLGLSLVVP
jgi:acetyl esterase/lipase